MMARMMVTVGSLVVAMSTAAFAQEMEIANEAPATKMRAGAQLEMLPLGSLDIPLGDGASVSADTAIAYGVSATFDYAVTPFLSVGVAPRAIFNIKGKDSDSDSDSSSFTEIDLRARVLAHFPVAKGIEVFGSASPGYSIVTGGDSEFDDPKGFAIAGAIGATYDLSPKAYLSAEVGYQRAFTSISEGDMSADMDLSFMHIGLGAGTRF